MPDVRINYSILQPLTGGYSRVAINFTIVQPLVSGFPEIYTNYQAAQPLLDGYPNLRNNFIIAQALFPVYPEPPMSEQPFPGFGNSTINPGVPAGLDPFNSALPGLAFSVHKKPMFKTNIKEAASGNEVRTAMMTYPRWDFELTYDFLKDTPQATAYTSLETIMGFFLQMQGAFNTFLFKDPDDYLVSNTLCGISDGLTLQYPLLRNLGGFYELVGQVDTANPIVISQSTEESTTIPSTPGPYTVTVTEAATFALDLGVIKGVTPMVRVSGVPAAGQYAVNTSTGVYTFNAVDQGDAIDITYTYDLATEDGYELFLPNYIVFDVAPANGTQIYASFQFFFACRFVDDQMDFEKFMDKLWNLQQCNFRSVIQ